jgi:hypothetical protein
MPIAGKVVAGTPALASDYNALVDAVQDPSTGHDHSGDAGKGTPVAHADLAGTTESGTGYTHTEIDAYMNTAIRWGGGDADPSKHLVLEMGYTDSNGWVEGGGTLWYKDITTTIDTVKGGFFNPNTVVSPHPVSTTSGAVLRLQCFRVSLADLPSGYWLAYGYMNT